VRRSLETVEQATGRAMLVQPNMYSFVGLAAHLFCENYAVDVRIDTFEVVFSDWFPMTHQSQYIREFAMSHSSHPMARQLSSVL
jgi:hypothetical protein